MLMFLALLAAGLFAGAAIYITAVEHPARVSCGTELAVREFAPSYKRATVMQATLAVAGCLAGLGAAWQRQDPVVALGAVLLGAVVPFTLIVIFPPTRGSSTRHSMRGGPKPRNCSSAGANSTQCAAASRPWRSCSFY